MKTQICIVTGQPLANLIAILHFKPEKVILVATDFMKEKSKQFKELLGDLDFIKGKFVLDGCPDTDLKKINAFLQEKLSPQLPAEPCVFNLTGGTKMHSFSMYEVFKQREYDDKFIYVDTQNRLLEYYPNKNIHLPNEPLSIVLDAKMTLTGMGKEFLKAASEEQNWSKKANTHAELTRFIAENIGDKNVQILIGSLNDLVGKLYNGGKSHECHKPKSGDLYQMPKGKAREILELAHGYDLITWHGNTKTVEFSNYSQARYLSGEWLEEYVWLVAQEIGFDELYSSLEFADESKKAKNEIDLFIQHQNVALAIECKSATGAKRADNSQDMFHKLSGVASRAGGLMCSKLFVSAFELKSANGQDSYSLLYAKDHDIKIVQAEEIINRLPDILTKWKTTGQLPKK